MALNLARRGFLDRLDDLVVTGATTEVAHHPVFDLVLDRMRVLLEQSLGGQDLARCADAALEAAVLQEALLDRNQLAILTEAFQRHDHGPVAQFRKQEAAAEHVIIHEDRAATTKADPTANLRTGRA